MLLAALSLTMSTCRLLSEHAVDLTFRIDLTAKESTAMPFTRMDRILATHAYDRLGLSFADFEYHISQAISTTNSTKDSRTRTSSRTITMATMNENTIPLRVSHRESLKLGESKIPGAGRGLFVMRDVKAGELVFEVPNVLLSIVSKLPPSAPCFSDPNKD